MSSLADVARHAGVSKATASRALSGAAHVSSDTRERVLRSASALSFVPSSHAVSLVTGRSRTIGVVVPAIGRWFFGEVLEGIEESLVRLGYDLTLFRVDADPQHRSRLFDYFLARKRVDGVISVSVALSPSEVHRLSRQGKPVIGVGGGIAGMSSLSIDDTAAGRVAAEHLLALGHRRIAYLSGNSGGAEDFEVRARRLAGYLAAMASAGLPDHARTTPDSVAGGRAATLELLASTQPPTAIVASCDEVAIGAILAARQSGIAVPEGLSVVGIDDHELAEQFSLTTVRQAPRDQGARAVTMLIAAIDGPPAAPQIVNLPVELLVRGSTAAVPR